MINPHGARRLTSAIILLAIRDAKKGDTAAKAWLDSPRCKHLLFYLDIDPNALQDADLAAIHIHRIN